MNKILDPQELRSFKRAIQQKKLLILECLKCGLLIRNVDPDDFDENFECPHCGADCDEINVYGTEA